LIGQAPHKQHTKEHTASIDSTKMVCGEKIVSAIHAHHFDPKCSYDGWLNNFTLHRPPHKENKKQLAFGRNLNKISGFIVIHLSTF
jgi:hypothetical protein